MDQFPQFTGDSVRYRYPFKRNVNYTPGVRHLAIELNAYWLIQAIAGYFDTPVMAKAIEDDRRLESLQFWTLTKHSDSSATLVCQADSDVDPAITQEISRTDCPAETTSIWAGYSGDHWTLYLPSEH